MDPCQQFNQLPIPLTKETIDTVCTLAAQQNDMNRYFDIRPYNDNCFNSPYYNASWLSEQRYLAAQGPQNDVQIARFEQMVTTAKASTIVMLTDVEENGLKKCVNYLDGWEQKPSLSLEGLTVEVREKDGVTHLWVKTWTDNSVILPKQLLALINEMKERKMPLISHCSAGIGRTGTFFVAMEAIRRGFDDPLTVFNVTKEFREEPTGRSGFVQTVKQYELAHRTWELARPSASAAAAAT